MKYSVEIPDRDYWKELIKCQAACPVHTDARGYLRAVAAGDDELAYFIARGPNPLASICGRVCGAPCEASCRRGDFDKPVAIRQIKRYLCEKHGTEAGAGGHTALVERMKEIAVQHGSSQCREREELLPLLQSLTNGKVTPVEGKSVGIIGSGPAGLAAAHDLALLGFSVTIYEMESTLAGMLVFGIPEYRLPRHVVQAEVEVITSLGVNAVLDCCVGRDVTLHELRERHDAVIVAVGAKRSRKLPIPGADAEGVLGGIEFLRDVALGEHPRILGRVVVIGGGNVAYDIGRTVMRQISIDAARTAAREPGVATVSLCSLESLAEMPADDLEIIEGDEEGVVRRNSLGPKEILTDDNGRVRGVRFAKCLRVFDSEHRFSPKFDEDDITEIPCDAVLMAIGQSFDLSFIDPESDGLKMLPNGAIECNSETGATSAPDVFVAGDLAYGPKLMIHAVASGKSVARAIYEKTTGVPIAFEDTELHFPLVTYAREKAHEKMGRLAARTIPVSERLLGQEREVERCFSEEQARYEAARCFNCGVNTIFNGFRCVLCGGCVEVCPMSCLRIVPLDSIEGPPVLDDIVEGRLDSVPIERASAIVKDETVCIRCALCAERCPTGAITMEEFQFQEKPVCLID